MRRCIVCRQTKQENQFYSNGVKRRVVCVPCVREMRKEFVRDLQQYKKKRGCVLCSYNDNEQKLHFHHIHPETKKFEISHAFDFFKYCGKYRHNLLNHPKIKAEIEKCIILCVWCHTAVSREERKLNAIY